MMGRHDMTWERAGGILLIAKKRTRASLFGGWGSGKRLICRKTMVKVRGGRFGLKSLKNLQSKFSAER